MSDGEGRARGISLWLVPPAGAARDLLARLTDRIAASCDTARFPPHLTLLADLALAPDEARNRASRVAQVAFPVEVELTRATGEDGYFRAIALEASPTPTLLAARRHARSAFGQTGDDAFRPHVSIAYGRIPAGRRASLVERAAEVLPISFTAAELEVMRTEGTPAEWKRIASLALRSSR